MKQREFSRERVREIEQINTFVLLRKAEMFRLGVKSSLISLRNYIPRNILKLYASNNVPQIDANNRFLTLQNSKLQQFLECLRRDFYNEQSKKMIDPANVNFQRQQRLSKIVELLEQYRLLEEQIEVIKNEKGKEVDKEFKDMIEEEQQVYTELMGKTADELLEQLPLLVDDEQAYPSLIFEINAGAGGQEAMLFAKELLQMYLGYFEYNDWNYEMLAEDVNDIGGLRHANLLVNDNAAYANLRFEAGVHRVQRVPATEKSGRIHTSTASVTVIPKPPGISVQILEKDLKIETKRASGAGGQHVNTTDSAVRIIHQPTGLAVENQTERSQIKNKEIAMRKLQALLERRQMENIESTVKDTRKAQQGNLNRNEKIRTYNFVQDRITDHRIAGCTVHNLKEFLNGGEYFDEFVQKLNVTNREKSFLEMLDNWKETK